MLRGILGVAAGVITGVIVTLIVETAGHTIYPPPSGIDLKDSEALKTIIAVVPMGAKIAVLAAWGLGVFVGSAVAIFVAERQSWPAWATAAALFGFALMTMVEIPHPDWMALSATALTLASAIAAAYIWARS